MLQLFDMPPTQSLAANVGAVSMNSLSSGWKPSVVMSQSQAGNSQPCEERFLSQPPTPQLKTPINNQATQNEPGDTFRQKPHTSAPVVLNIKKQCGSENDVVSLASSYKTEANTPSLAADVMGTAAEPMQSAAQARAAKWAPRPVLAHPDQATAITSSQPAKPLYVPVFSKKTKPG